MGEEREVNLAEIAELDDENEESLDAEEYIDGSEVDSEEVNSSDDEYEEEYEEESYTNSFISDTGDIVVMDEDKDENAFELVYLNIEQIGLVKRIRQLKNVDGLVKSIKSTGMLEPIVVGLTATDGFYVLLHGFRRLIACAKANKKRIPCIVNKKVSTINIPIVEALYNQTQKYSIKETVDYIDYLEKENGIMSASLIEYLLQMNPGDYTKLKDILNDNDDDIVDKLYSGVYSIEQAFRKLEQRRKKETIEEKENRKAEQVYGDESKSGIDMVAGSGEESDGNLTAEEIAELSFNANDLDDGLEDESLDNMVKESDSIDGFKPNKQDYHDRVPLDPKLRKSILARDNNTCQVCKVISGMEYIDVLDVHHIVEVYLGGDDSKDNLITTCTVCHKLIHLHGRGELYIRPYEEMSEDEANKFKRIVKLGNVIRKGLVKKGMTKQELKKVDKANTIGRTKPGTGQVAG